MALPAIALIAQAISTAASLSNSSGAKKLNTALSAAQNFIKK